MDEKAKENLERLEAELAALKEKLASLEAEVALYRTAAEAEAPVDLSDVVVLPDLPEEPQPVPEPTVPVEEPEAPAEEEPAPQETAPKRELRRISGEYRWQKDRPGAPVKNIRSGISLYDRALFINTLFNEDFSLYDETVAALNACESFDEAVDYLLGTFPDWNYGGDAVYAFMMAIRKKLS